VNKFSQEKLQARNMDSFLKTFYPQLQAPGVEAANNNGVFHLSTRMLANLTMGGFPYSRSFTMTQGMSWLGNVQASQSGVMTSLDGMSKTFLTPEGTINMQALASQIKTQCGLQTAVYSTHMANAERWDYSDNHVALLTNMLRWVLLKHLERANGDRGLLGTLPLYADGHVKIDRNALLPSHYPEAAGHELSWPGGVDPGMYPNVARLVAFCPTDDSPAIDLRGFNEAEACFVLAMLGPWHRTTRYMLDFETPALAESVQYRRGTDARLAESWLSSADGAEVVVPAAPTVADAWSALTKYITVNRLYDQWAVAVQLVSQTMCQMLPESAEGQAWLALPREVVIPHFASLRGRYPLFNEGDAALLSHRAMREWAFLGSRVERLFLYGMCLTQAYQTGASVRAVRQYNEEHPTDITSTAHWTLSTDTHFAAYVSEATRSAAPLNMMTDAYVTTPNINNGRLSTAVDIPVDVTAADGYNITTVDGKSVLRVQSAPQPGVPNLLLPLDPYNVSTPYTLAANIDIPVDQKGRTGCMLSPYKAWELAWVARVCGFDVLLRKSTETVGPRRFFASNETSWTNCLQFADFEENEQVRVVGIERRQHVFIEFPPIHTKRYQQAIQFVMQPIDLTIKADPSARGKRIADFGTYTGSAAATDIRINVPEGISKLRGSILRERQDFHYVDSAQAGVIPQTQQGLVAADVAVDGTAGGTG
jgi:hypothetical protein